MKKILLLLLVLLMMLQLTACGGSVPEATPDLDQMKEICELATLECYYHNVAKYNEPGGFWFWESEKVFWIEYSGIVTVGVDISMVSLEVSGDTVTITLPEAKVFGCKVDSASLTEDSFIISPGSGGINAEDQVAALSGAQADLEAEAASDTTLLAEARQRAKELLEDYVLNIGDAVGKQYTIKWIYLDSNGNSVGTDVTVPDADDGASQE